ncbi:MAG: TonB-dependent siderophore receptor [Acetobacter orientalis]|uniref:TonB-dependent siderophore receptor n=1 Tax=Acetobacter orientalis TaxID=146474 RepID=UPI0039EC9596
MTHSLYRQSAFVVRRCAFLLLASSCLSGFTPRAAQAESTEASQAKTKPFSIPAQPLKSALRHYFEQSGVQVAYPTADAANINSTAVSGQFSASAALSQLLAGTGLSYSFTAPHSATLTKTTNAITLGPVRVAGTNTDPMTDWSVGNEPGRTEGTHSYTTGAMSTATGLRLSIRQTPQSVTVLTRQQLDDRRINSFADVVRTTNGLSINQYESNRGSIYSRGFKIQNYLIDGVQTLINEQWSAGEIMSDTVLYDRIEILRGAGGLMNGSGDPSAMINMVRKRADSKKLRATVTAEGGSWSHFRTTGDISSAVSKNGKTRARFVADYQQGGNALKRLDTKQYTLFATMEQDIGENTLLSAGVSYQNTLTAHPQWGGVPAWTADESGNIVRRPSTRRDNVAPDWSYWNTSYANAFVRAEHNFGRNWRATLNYSLGERRSKSKIALFYPYPIDPDTGQSFMSFYGFKIPVSGYSGRYFVRNSKNDVDFKLNGHFKVFGLNQEVVVGYEWWREHMVANGAPGNTTLAATPDINAFTPHTPEPKFVTRGNYINNVTTQSAPFIAGKFSLHQRVNLITGTRAVNYDVSDYKNRTNNYTMKYRFVPYVGLVVDLQKNISAYGSYTTIFNPQNYRDANNKLLAPIQGNTAEVGIKGEFLRKRLNFSLAFYRMKQANVAQYQGRVPEDAANPNGLQRSVYGGVPGVTSRGIEAEITGEITKTLHIVAGYSQFILTHTGTDAVNSLIPRKQANLFLTYQMPGALHNLTVGGGLRWQSRIYEEQPTAIALGVPRLTQKAYMVGDVFLRYDFPQNWSAQLNINNIADTKIFSPTEDGMQVYWQNPRSAQFQIRKTF